MAYGGADDQDWAAADAVLVRLVDELHRTAAVSDALWAALATHWSNEEVLGLLVLAGWYHVIAYSRTGCG